MVVNTFLSPSKIFGLGVEAFVLHCFQLWVKGWLWPNDFGVGLRVTTTSMMVKLPKGITDTIKVPVGVDGRRVMVALLTERITTAHSF